MFYQKLEGRVLLESSSSNRVFNIYALLEEQGKLNLAGEGGKFSGTEKFWKPLSPYFSKNKEKKFSIYSIGGGQGFDAESIRNVLLKKGLEVETLKSIDNNPLTSFLNKERVKLQDADSFLESLPSRDDSQRRIFHLGNFLSVMKPEEISIFIKKLSKKMEEGDIISIINICPTQFEGLGFLKKGDSKIGSELGLEPYCLKQDGSFFRTRISEKFEDFLKEQSLSCYSKKLGAHKLDSGPENYKMHLIAIFGEKNENP